MKVAVISESEFSVQGHGVHTAFVETVNALKKYTDCDVVVNTREPADVRHIHTIGFYCLQQILFCKGKKVISAHVVPDSFVGSLRFAEVWAGVFSWYMKFFYNLGNAVIAVSEATREDLLKLGVKRPIYVVHNMVDIARYVPSATSRSEARQKFGIADDAFVVVSNGQVQPRKRVDLFIAMAKAMPDATFIWVGGIPFKGAAAGYEKMKRLMKNAPANVRFTDVVPLEDVKKYLHAADAFVMPSDQETFGLAIVEAAAAGLPVVLRNLHDYDKTFRGMSVMCEEDGFVDALTRLRTDKAFYDASCGLSAAMAKKYDSRTIAGELVELYGSLGE